VFVEQPLAEAFAPLYALLARTGLLLLAGLVLAVAASLVVARRMVTPIQAIQTGAARFATGKLDERIEVRTGDELESARARVQPHGEGAAGVLRGPRAQGRGANAPSLRSQPPQVRVPREHVARAPDAAHAIIGFPRCSRSACSAR